MQLSYSVCDLSFRKKKNHFSNRTQTLFILAIAAGLQRVAKHEGWEFFHEFDNSGDHVTDAESHRWHKYSKGWELFKDPGKSYTTTH